MVSVFVLLVTYHFSMSHHTVYDMFVSSVIGGFAPLAHPDEEVIVKKG